MCFVSEMKYSGMILSGDGNISFSQMNVKIHNPSYAIKKLNGTPGNHIPKEFYGSPDGSISILTGSRKDKEFFNRLAEKKNFDRHTHLERFKEWRMPEQFGGYIKAKRHGLL